eukprot:1175105-Pyramimonas_sp.AAC.1
MPLLFVDAAEAAGAQSHNQTQKPKDNGGDAAQLGPPLLWAALIKAAAYLRRPADCKKCFEELWARVVRELQDLAGQ